MNKSFCLAFFFCVSSFTTGFSQIDSLLNVRIEFLHKGGSVYSLEEPHAFLSAESIQRRINQQISLDSSDLPVPYHFIDSLVSKGAQVLFTSKWMNSAVVVLPDSQALKEILAFSFVNLSQRVAYKSQVMEFQETLIDSNSPLAVTYGTSYRQVEMLNGHTLHRKGYNGKGKTIAVIDAGFIAVEHLNAFAHLRDEGRILMTRNMYTNDPNVYSEHTHGLSVLSIIAGIIPGKLIGSGTGAHFHLLISENVTYEFPIEEDAWVAAAELADSAGVDIINTSLGYTTFDSAIYNYSTLDMDGRTAFISRAAEIASQKGILIVNSAGNQGNTDWGIISAPADADNVLAVGAVNSQGHYASFSSRGPASDGRIKPDITAMGQGTVLSRHIEGEVATSNGTSLSAPVISGLAASLWQACPHLTSNQLRELIIRSSSHYHNPDAFVGHGLPDFYFAYRQCSEDAGNQFQDKMIVSVFPNPFIDRVELEYFSDEAGHITVHITDASGRLIYKEEFPVAANTLNKYPIRFGEYIPNGVYVLHFATPNQVLTRKLLRFAPM